MKKKQLNIFQYILLGIVAFLCQGAANSVSAQQFTGLSGLLHTPSAEMYAPASGRFAYSFLNRNFVAAYYNVNVHSYALAVTPFKWVEASFIGMARKNGNVVYHDRMCAVKFRPLAEKEGKWWPSVAIGCIDPFSTLKSGKDDENNMHMCNAFVSLSKHFNVAGELGVHLSGRYYLKSSNSKWNFAVGGLTWRPFFAPQGRLTVEWDGREVNMGIDAKFFKHLYVQAILQNFRYFSCSLCFEINHL